MLWHGGDEFVEHAALTKQRVGASLGRQLVAGFWGTPIRLLAANDLGFLPVPPNRVASSFLEGQNGWKPTRAGDSHAIGSRNV